MGVKTWIAALLGCLLSGAGLAAEPGICKSVCDTERSTCKANVRDLALEKYDGPIVVEAQRRNELARTAELTQGGARVQRVEDQAGVQTRETRLRSACEDKYARCTRACTAEAVPDSPVFVKRPRTN